MDDVTLDAMQSLLTSLATADETVRPFVVDGLALADSRRRFLASVMDELCEAAQRVKDSLGVE